LLAVSFSGHINDKNNRLSVYDLISGQHLFKDPLYLNQFVFDSQGALLYLGGENGGFAETHTHEKLMRWNPITQQTNMIAEQSVKGSALEFRLYDLVQDTNKLDCQSVLSIDGRWWIVPRMDDTSVWYERLDTRTGISAGKLQLPAMKESPSSQQVISMCLTKEADVLLVETNLNNKTELNWIDLSTDQLLHSAIVPGGIDHICVAQKDLTVVMTQTASPEEKPMLMAFHGAKRELRLIPLNEIEKHQAKPPQYSKRKMPTPEVALYSPMVDVQSMTAVIGWRYCSHLTERAIGNGPPDFTEWSPEYYYSVRDLKTGSLLHTGCLNLLSGKNPFDIKNNTLDARMALPGPILVLSQYIVESEPEGFLAKWFNKMRNWLNLSPGYLHKLHFIDARSGTVTNTLQNQYTGGRLSLSPDEKTLTISCYWDGEEAQLEYDYPLHQPWLLIWSWALGVACGITVLVEVRRWWRQHRQKLHG